MIIEKNRGNPDWKFLYDKRSLAYQYYEEQLGYMSREKQQQEREEKFGDQTVRAPPAPARTGTYQ